MSTNFVYLNDKNFLKALDNETHREQYIRIEVLKFQDETLLANIEGKATAGSCNLNGSSNMRRTASCTIAVDPDGIEMQGYTTPQQYYNIADVENLISMNKKVKIYTGFTNSLTQEYPQYADYDIIWFPLGLYVIRNASISRNNSGINISLTLNDKTALLNGDMGGTIPAATVFSEQELYNATGTARSVEKILIKDIIKYLVVEFGGESPENIIITDIPDTITKVMKWNDKKNTLYIYNEGADGNGGVQYALNLPTTDYDYANEKKYYYGYDIGYTLEPFVYPGTLECKAGETIASVLDKIKNALGNFEWFYDVYGKFHFQEIKNYLNTSITTTLLNLSDADYLTFANFGLSEYTFDNQKIITSISSSPQYSNIKNDYVVWGTTKTATGAEKPIRYHIAFDNKPRDFEDIERYCLVYTDYKGLQQVIVLKEGENYSSGQPTKDSNKNLYYINGTQIWHWDDELDPPNFREMYENEAELCYLQTDDWRTELYFEGLEASDKTFSKNYYAAELNAEWPKIYDVKQTPNGTHNGLPLYTGGYRTDVSESSYEYWLDFLEGDSTAGLNISQFNVNNIGRRTKVVSDKATNCIFSIDYPEYVLIEADGDVAQDREDANKIKGANVVQVSPEIWKKISLGGSKTSAFEKIKELLFTNTNYNESISLSVIPIYYLEPNTRITVVDNNTGINGDYLIKTISLPLTATGTSTISATRCLEKTF